MAKFVAKSIFLRRERNVWDVLQRQKGLLDRSKCSGSKSLDVVLGALGGG